MTADLCFALALIGAVLLAIFNHRDDAQRRHEEEWFFG